jgi:hypothetical protein
MSEYKRRIKLAPSCGSGQIPAVAADLQAPLPSKCGPLSSSDDEVPEDLSLHGEWLPSATSEPIPMYHC